MVIGKFTTNSICLIVVLDGKPVRVLAIAHKTDSEKICLHIIFNIWGNNVKNYTLYGELNCITFRSKTKLYETVMEIINLNESKIVKALQQLE